MSVHIHAPAPTQEHAIVDYNCPFIAGGARCGSYHALAVLTPWYGWSVICCSCGGVVEDDEAVRKMRDVARVRERFEALRRAG